MAAPLLSLGRDGEPARRRDDGDRVVPDHRRQLLAASPRRARRSRCAPISRTRAHYLHQLSGAEPSAERARALETYLNTVCDHGLNASTFAARVIVSTRSDRHLGDHRRRRRAQGSAARRRAGPGARHGVRDRHAGARRSRDPRQAGSRRAPHGIRPSRLPGPRSARRRAGARGRALLRERRRSTRSTIWRDASRRRRCACCASASRSGGSTPTSSSTRRCCCTAWDLPSELFTPTFAVGRVAGWSAHCLEQLPRRRLIRPQSAYVGPTDRRYDREALGALPVAQPFLRAAGGCCAGLKACSTRSDDAPRKTASSERA